MAESKTTKNITSKGMDPLHNEAIRQIQEDVAAIEQAKKSRITTTLTKTELDDINKLNARRAKSKGTAKFDKKLSGEDTVILKKLEAEKSKQVFNTANVHDKIVSSGGQDLSKLSDDELFNLRESLIRQQNRNSLVKADTQAINEEMSRRRQAMRR